MYVVYNFSLALPNAAGKRKTAVAGGLKVYKEKGGYEMRSKIAKKLLATSVLTAMTIGLVGCGEDAVTNEQPTQAPAKDDPKPTEAPATPSTDEKEPEAPVVEDEPEVSPYTVKTDANGNAYDLGGMEVTIRDWWSPGDGLVETAMNAYDEERLAFYDWMQETYNFTLVRKGISDWGSTPADFMSMLLPVVTLITTYSCSVHVLTLLRLCTVVFFMTLLPLTALISPKRSGVLRFTPLTP